MDLKSTAINAEIDNIANTKLCNKLINKYFVPAETTTEVPVNTKS